VNKDASRELAVRDTGLPTADRSAHCTANVRGAPNYGVRGVGFSTTTPNAAPVGGPLGVSTVVTTAITPASGALAPPGAPGHATTMVLDIPGFQMRALIGRGGQTINEIRQRAQAHIHITGERLTIHGNVELAQQLIFEVLRKKLPQCFQPPPNPAQAMAYQFLPHRRADSAW